jgi:hypothetical protein
VLRSGQQETDTECMGFAVKWSLSCLIIVPLAMLLLAFGSWFGLVLIGMGVTAFGVVMVTDYRGLTSGMRGAAPDARSQGQHFRVSDPPAGCDRYGNRLDRLRTLKGVLGGDLACATFGNVPRSRVLHWCGA